MIESSLTDRLNQSISWLCERQWAEWEVLTIAITALFVLVWITRRQRRRSVRNIYENQFLESSPVIGMNLGVHRRSRRVIGDLKKGRLAVVQKKHPKQQKPTNQTDPSEKLHEQIKQLQYEIIKRKQVEVRLEERVAHLTTANETLQCELAGIKQAGQESKEQIAEEPAAEVPNEKTLPQEKPAGSDGKYDDLHRIVDGIEQKLCRKCDQWKPESEFYKNASSKDGLTGSCKTCKAEAAREYRKRRKAAKD